MMRIPKKTGLVLALTLTLMLTVFPATMPTAHASPITLNPIADSWVETQWKTLNHGGDNTLHCRSDTSALWRNVTKRSYLKFNLTGIDPNTIYNATLYLYCKAATIPPDYMDVDVHETGDVWTEYGIDWNNAPAVGAYITTTAVDGAGLWYGWGGDAVKNYVKAEAAGDDIVSFVLKLPNDTVYIHDPFWHRDFSSKEGSCSPYLKIFAPPVACFTVSNDSPNTCETVTFNASCSYDPDGTIVKYEWDWEGDCIYDFDAGNNPIATHHYETHGLYYPKLRVTDNEGLTDETNTTILVLVRGHPVAAFTWTPPTPTVDQTVNFDASASTPDGGTIANYTWNFGDGSLPVTEADPITNHTYTRFGTYNVTLTVTDDDGLADTIWKLITVYLRDVAVISVAPSLTEVYIGEGVTITVVAKNQGKATETFNITAHYDENILGTKSVTELAPGKSITLTFSWDTSGVPEGNYTIKAVATTVPGELDIWDNTKIDGTVKVKPARDVAVVGVTPLVTEVDVGEVVNITVTVKNEGTVTESFEVTLYYDDAVFGTQTVTILAPGTETTLIFSWDTTGVPEADYTIKAVASKVLGETDIADNIYVDGKVTVKSPSVFAFPRELAILSAIVAAAIVLTILAALLYRRRRRKSGLYH